MQCIDKHKDGITEDFETVRSNYKCIESLASSTSLFKIVFVIATLFTAILAI